MRTILTLCIAAVFAVLLSGCAGMTDIITKQDILYAPKAFDAGSQQAAFSVASAAAKAHYGTTVAGEKAVPALIDSGIAVANGKCRDWLGKVNETDLRWQAGEGNVGVWQGLAMGAMAAIGVHRDVLTVAGLGSAAWLAYDANFRATALRMADWAKQTKMLEVMEARAAELRAQASQMTWPDAIDRLEAYGRLCTAQAAEAAVRSSINSTITRATPAGTLTSTPK